MMRWCIVLGVTVTLLGGCVYDPLHELSCTVDGDCPSTAVCRDSVCVEEDSSDRDMEMPDGAEPIVTRVAVSPGIAELVRGETADFTATAFDQDQAPISDFAVDWSVADDSIAAVDDGGTVTAEAPGTTTLTATVDGVSGTAELTVFESVVSVEVMPAEPTLLRGRSETLTATPLDAEGAVVEGRQAEWASSDPDIVDVDVQTGTVTALRPGSATVTAAVGDVTGQTTVTVEENAVEAVQIQLAELFPADPNLNPMAILEGSTATYRVVMTDMGGVELDPRGRTISWDVVTSAPNVAVPLQSNEPGTGRYNHLVPGTGTLTVVAEGVSDELEFTVVQPPITDVNVIGLEPTMAVGAIRTLTLEVTAGGEPLDDLDDRTVTWESDARDVADVDETGQFVAKAPGTVEITVTVDDFPVVTIVDVVFQLDQVSAGFDHSCGVSPDGIGFCWGSGADGKLGVSMPPSDSAEPLPIQGLQFSGVWAADSFSCGLERAGRAYCWGASGRTGVMDGSQSDVPREVDGARTYTTLRAAFEHACAIEAVTDKVWCWGAGGAGRLGNNETNDALAPVEVMFSGSGTPTDLAIGAAHTCMVTDTPKVWCWGADTSGALGDGPENMNSSVPIEVMSLSTESIVEVTAGNAVTCARVMNTSDVYCWGTNAAGQLGIGDDMVADKSLPELLPGVNLTTLDLGSAHGCGVSAANGEVLCWGESGKYRLGDMNNSADAFAPAPTSTNLVATSVTAGDAHTCAIAPDSRPYCWGDNAKDRSGTSSDGQIQAPALVWPAP